jgi:hypothetical protein
VVAKAPTPTQVVITPAQERDRGGYLNWTYQVWEALSKHNSNFITSYTADGQVNYFTHVHTFDPFIIADMADDARRYRQYHNTYNTDSFRHDISNEYSSRWNGPMIYDSITIYQEVWERNGVYHHAYVRFTVGYTLPDNRIYALVMKVL